MMVFPANNSGVQASLQSDSDDAAQPDPSYFYFTASVAPHIPAPSFAFCPLKTNPRSSHCPLRVFDMPRYPMDRKSHDGMVDP
jgi:hypothetical protein